MVVPDHAARAILDLAEDSAPAEERDAARGGDRTGAQ
jgi:hypothetical protein